MPTKAELVVSGRSSKVTTPETGSVVCVSTTILSHCCDSFLDTHEEVTNFRSLESIGITDSPARSDDKEATHQFQSTVTFIDGRHEVQWPWKLPDNYGLASGRLKSLLKRLASGPELLRKCDAVPEAIEKYGQTEQTEKMFPSAGLNVREWSTNYPVVQTRFVVDQAPCNSDLKVLGMNKIYGWISLPAVTIKHVPYINKREILQAATTVFDPFGFTTPVTYMYHGELFLPLWAGGVSWEESLSQDLMKTWTRLSAEWHELPQCRIKRQISRATASCSELHAFTDASQNAYGVAAYLRILHGNNIAEVHLVLSKLGHSQTKKGEVTLPRVELLGVLIGTRALGFFSKELVPAVKSLTLWTVALCVLYWLTSIKQHSVFFENREKQRKKRAER